MKEDVTENEVAEETAAQANLSIGDLTNLRQIIDVATQRGAFKADELEVVGNTYNRLNAFLGAISANIQPEGDATEGDSETTADSDAGTEE